MNFCSYVLFSCTGPFSINWRGHFKQKKQNKTNDLLFIFSKRLGIFPIKYLIFYKCFERNWTLAFFICVTAYGRAMVIWKLFQAFSPLLPSNMSSCKRFQKKHLSSLLYVITDRCKQETPCGVWTTSGVYTDHQFTYCNKPTVPWPWYSDYQTTNVEHFEQNLST